jgi:Arc/MetJ-type ribon-helix-helix transcriptional regulator
VRLPPIPILEPWGTTDSRLHWISMHRGRDRITPQIVAKSMAVKSGKRGRLIGIRLPQEMIPRIDQWSKRNRAANRSDAIRHLLELALTGPQRTQRPKARSASKASKMAGRVIDKLGDPSATEEEQHTRKRRLLEGPKEFRSMRGK